MLLGTAAADDIFPAVAAEVCGIIGARHAAGLDVSAACTGFLGCLQLASGLIEAGRAETVLVIGAEKLSAITDPEDKRTAMLFADAAGAMVADPHGRPGGARAGRPALGCPARHPLRRPEAPAHRDGRPRGVQARHQPDDRGHARGARGRRATLDDVDLFVYHQANARIVRSVGQRLGLDPARVVDAIAGVGNVSAASLPLALAAARDDGRLVPGTRVLLSAFGAGFVWGAAMLDWKASA